MFDDKPVGGDVAQGARRRLAAWACGFAGPSPEHVADGGDADALIAAAVDGRVMPALAAALDRGDLTLSDDRAADVAVRRRRVIEHCLRIEALLLDVVDEFGREGIDYRVLKGSAAAHLDYPDPALRQFGDLDLLVASADFDRVVTLLEARGLPRRFPEPRPGFAARFWKSVSVRGDLEVDVHRTLADGPVGPRIDVADLWGEPDTFVVAGRVLRALPAPQRLLHACLHAYLAPPPARLSSLADVGRGLLTVDPEPVVELARRWHVAPALVGAADEVVATAGWPEGVRLWWRDVDAGSKLDAALIGMHRGARSGWVGRSLATAAVLPGLRNRIDYVTGLAVPDRSYVDDERRGDGGRVRRLRDRVRRGGR